MIEYTEHVRFRETYYNVKEVMLENCPEKEFSDGWKNILEQIQSRFYSDEAIKPWTEFNPDKDELCDPEDRRYPNPLFLVSLHYSNVEFTKENWDHLIELIIEAWYCFSNDDIFLDEGCDTLELYTGGWSGNEDIIRALYHTVFALYPHTLERDRECPAVYRLKMPKCFEVEND